MSESLLQVVHRPTKSRRSQPKKKARPKKRRCCSESEICSAVALFADVSSCALFAAQFFLISRIHVSTKHRRSFLYPRESQKNVSFVSFVGWHHAASQIFCVVPPSSITKTPHHFSLITLTCHQRLFPSHSVRIFLFLLLTSVFVGLLWMPPSASHCKIFFVVFYTELVIVKFNEVVVPWSYLGAI